MPGPTRKCGSPDPNDPAVVQVEVRAKQFEWRLRYPGLHGGKLGEPGELFTVNDLHVPVGHMVLVHLKSEDVLHSFFLPNMRVKQDAVPGMSIPVLVQADADQKIGVYDIVCSQLCRWGQYNMKGRLTVESEADYQAWLADLEQAAERKHRPAEAAPKAAEGTSE